jgi:biotin carboxylase
VLAVGHGYRSVPPLQLAVAASGLCDIVWLVDAADPEIDAVGALLGRIGTVIDIGPHSPHEAATLLAVHHPDGIVAYRDEDLAPLSAIAACLGLPFHEPAVALRLADKLAQRWALADAGVPVPRAWELASSADPSAVASVAAEAVYPVVVKPRRGSGSWHTFLAHNAAELTAVLDELRRDGAEGEEMVVEEHLPSRSGTEGDGFADYVSVETIVSGGTATHVAVTGRTPLAEPFRETGFCIPAALGGADLDAVLAMASTVVAALELQTGCVHTEIKSTPDGPRVIEVNGRVGGGVPDMLASAAGVDLFELSMRVALGERLELPGLFPCASVGYRFFYQPPMAARRVLSVDGLDRVAALPGVESVFLHRGPGREVDARQGTRAYIFSVVGSTADHDGVLATDRAIKETVDVAYASADAVDLEAAEAVEPADVDAVDLDAVDLDAADEDADADHQSVRRDAGGAPSDRPRPYLRREVGHSGSLRTVS